MDFKELLCVFLTLRYTPRFDLSNCLFVKGCTNTDTGVLYLRTVLLQEEYMAKPDKVRIIPRGGVSIVCNDVMQQAAEAAQHRLKQRGVSDISLQTLNITRFPCGEVKPRITENVRGKEVFLFYGFTPLHFNDELITLMLALAALDKADCKRVTLVLPFFPYTRQDRKDEARVPLSARAVIDMLCLSSSLERIVTMDMHSEQLESCFSRGVKMDHLPGSLLVAPWIQKTYKKKLRDLVVVAPDNGSAKRAKKLALLIAPGTPIAIFDKERDKDGTKLGDIIGASVEGKTCIINDDMIDTGGTIADAALALKALGAKEVIISATHAIFSSKKGVSAYDTLAKAGSTVVVTDSLPTELRDWLTVISIGTLLGNVMFENITHDGSVSKIINGEVK